MAAVVVENGSAEDPLANSFVSAADVTAYAAARANTAWADADPDLQAKYLLDAALYLANEQRFVFRGNRKTYTQRLPFPRVGCAERFGPLVPSDVIPWRVKDAQCELALQALATASALQGALERGGKTTTETVDSLTTSFAEDAPGETVYPAVVGLLQPLLRDTGLQILAQPIVSITDAPPEYTAGTYKNNSGLL